MSRPRTACPACHAAAEVTCRVTGGGNAADGPEVGALSVCGSCGYVSVFGDELRLRRLTKEERAAVDTHPRFARARAAIAAAEEKIALKAVVARGRLN